jgi:hypothetical protein
MRSAAARLGRGLLRNPFLLVPPVFYYLTSARGVGASDSALIVDEMRGLVLSTHANHHNLTLLVGRLFLLGPGEDPARLANLASVFLGSFAVGLFYLVVRQRSASELVAAASAAALMVSHSLWWHSTIVEAYAWNAILTVAALALLQRLQKGHSERALAALFFVAGLSFFNHVQMGILLAGAAAYVAGHLLLARRAGAPAGSLRALGVCAASFLAGFVPYAVTFAFDVRRSGGLAPAVRQALGGDFQSVMAKGSPGAALADVAFLVVLQFPSPFLLAVAAGAVILWRRWKSSAALLGLAVAFAVNTAFFAFYNTWDKFAFLLPSFVVLAYAGSFAVEESVARARRRRSVPVWIALGTLALASVTMPPLVYARLVDWSRWGGPLARFDNTGNPIRKGEYLANPDKSRNDEFGDYVRRLFERLPPNATYVDDDGHAFYPVRYYQAYRGQRPDIRAELVNAWGIAGWGLSPEAFAELAYGAYRRSEPFFLVSIDEPFYSLIVRAPGLDRLRFRRFPLDERRFIYRLVGAAEGASLAPEPPLGLRLRTASGLGPEPPRTELAAGDPVFAVLEFEPNGEPFEVEFAWTPPDGSGPIRSSPVSLPFGCRRAWAEMDRTGPLAPGTWRVQATSAGRAIATASFVVRGPASAAAAAP